MYGVGAREPAPKMVVPDVAVSGTPEPSRDRRRYESMREKLRVPVGCSLAESRQNGIMNTGAGAPGWADAGLEKPNGVW